MESGTSIPAHAWAQPLCVSCPRQPRATSSVLLPRGGTAATRMVRPREVTPRVLPFFGHLLLAFGFLFSLPQHPGGLQPPLFRQRDILLLLCPQRDDSHVLGPGHLSSWQGQAPVPLHPAVSPALVPGPHPDGGVSRGQQK